MNEYPVSVNMEMIKSKNLNKSDNYLKLSTLYKKVFQNYFCKILNLMFYDNLIEQSGLFKKCLDVNKDYYQLNSDIDLKYIYFRNNYNVENLSVEDINTFLTVTNNEILETVVAKTFKDVIKINNMDGKHYDGRFKTQYIKGSSSKDTLFYNDSLIIFIRSDNNDINKNKIIEKNNFMNSLKKKMISELKNKIDCEIEIYYMW